MLKDRYTQGEWGRVDAGAATLVYGENGERICKIMDNKNDADLIEDVPSFIWLIEQLYNDLPQNRDWLNPDHEAMMKWVVKRYCKKEVENNEA